MPDYCGNLINRKQRGKLLIFVSVIKSCSVQDQRTTADIEFIFAILRSRENPQILWVNDAKIVGDGVAILEPVSRHVFA